MTTPENQVILETDDLRMAVRNAVVRFFRGAGAPGIRYALKHNIRSIPVEPVVIKYGPKRVAFNISISFDESVPAHPLHLPAPLGEIHDDPNATALGNREEL